MYLVGKGHEHMGPGTSMVQFIDATRGEFGGLGLVPEFSADCAQMGGRRGLGCGCTKPCNGCGLGFFDGGMDVSTWGPMEWGAVALVGYMVASTVFTTGRAVSRVRALPKERRHRKAARLRLKAMELTRKR